MPTLKIYPNDPLALVSCQIDIKVEKIPTLSTSRKLQEFLPERKDLLSHQIKIDQESPKAATTKMISSPRWLSRDRRTHHYLQFSPLDPDGSTIVTAVVETTDYKGFEKFNQLVSAAIENLLDSVQNPDLSRIELRYLDELRVPSDSTTGHIDWQLWISEDLLYPLNSIRNLVQSPIPLQTLSVLQAEDDKFVKIRHGRGQGYEFEGVNDFSRELPSPGPYFLLDITTESFFAPGTSPRALPQKLDDLHTTARGVFESLITDKFRKEVLENDRHSK